MGLQAFGLHAMHTIPKKNLLTQKHVQTSILVKSLMMHDFLSLPCFMIVMGDVFLSFTQYPTDKA